MANYINDKLVIQEFEGRGRCLCAIGNLKKGELLMTGIAVATGTSTLELQNKLRVKLNQMPLSNTL